MPSFSSFETILNEAESTFAVDFQSLNNSGVTGTGLIAISPEQASGEQMINVSITVEGMEPNSPVPQHIHGLFDGAGAPIDSTTPDISSDADGDGLVEVLEGLNDYGDIILTLSDEQGGEPMTDANGNFTYIMSFDLNDDSNFFSPVSMTDYSSEDLLPLALREIVLHGVNVPAGLGAGTGGEVDGTQDGFVPILPAAAGEIESVSLADALAILDTQRAVAGEEIVLGDGGEAADGTDADDNISGGAGNDTADGGAGDDTITGAGGDDELTGNAGSDVIDGDEGNDVINAGENDDDALNQASLGASGGLSLSDYDNGYAGGAGDDLINGGAGDDIITGDDDSRVSSASGGAFDASADGSDTIFGGAGNDEIHTGSWSDSDDGLPNAQTGMAGDIAFGGDGNDILRGAGGDDFLGGDAGDDNIGGGGGNDSINGNDGDDVLNGDAGDDEIASGSGNDTASGGDGNDNMGGGLGDDMMSGDAGNDTMGGGQGDDTVDGGAGDDITNGGSGNDMITGGEGNDTAGAGDGMDMVSGGAGDDSLGGGSGDDTVDGGDGNDAIGGGDGDDSVSGGAGDDFVAGGAGADMVSGDAGDDRLNGGTGDDTMTGGDGADTFVFNEVTSGEVDMITDFTQGEDMLELQGGVGFDDVTIADASSAAGIAASVSIEGHTILLDGVNAALVTEADFMFV